MTAAVLFFRKLRIAESSQFRIIVKKIPLKLNISPQSPLPQPSVSFPRLRLGGRFAVSGRGVPPLPAVRGGTLYTVRGAGRLALLPLSYLPTSK